MRLAPTMSSGEEKAEERGRPSTEGGDNSKRIRQMAQRARDKNGDGGRHQIDFLGESPSPHPLLP